MLDHSREDKQAPHHPDPQKKGEQPWPPPRRRLPHPVHQPRRVRPPEPRAAALPDEPGREPDPPRALRLPHHSPSPDHRTPLRGHPTRTKKTAKPSPPPTTAKTTRRRHQVLAAQVSDIIDTHWKQGAGYHTLHKIATQPLSWCPPLSTTNPDKSPTLGHPANHDMHQRTGQRRKAQAHKSHPGYGTQHAAPWGHTFAPPPDMSRLHTFTHQGSPTRLRPTRNNPPQPQEDTPQGDLQPGRQNQTDQTQRRTTTSTQTPTTAKDTTRSLTKSP